MSVAQPAPVSRRPHPRELIEDDGEPLTFVPVSAAVAAELERLHPHTVQRASNRKSKRVVTKTTTERVVVEDEIEEEPAASMPVGSGYRLSDGLGRLFYWFLVVLAAGAGTFGLYHLLAGGSGVAIFLFICMFVFIAGVGSR